MVFNSVVFLFCFYAAGAAGCTTSCPGRGKNAVLLVESLLFFCWGGISMAAAGRGPGRHSTTCGGASACQPARRGQAEKACCLPWHGAGQRLAALVYCKYARTFLLDTLNRHRAFQPGPPS